MLIPEQEFDLLYQQAIAEVYADDFTEVGQIVSIRGRKPAEKEALENMVHLLLIETDVPPRNKKTLPIFWRNSRIFEEHWSH